MEKFYFEKLSAAIKMSKVISGAANELLVHWRRTESITTESCA